MDGELLSFIKVWISAITSLFYCYYITSYIPKGILRLFSLLPIIFLFTILPLNLSSFQLGVPTIFYLVWLGNFKLILFSFGQGPLSSLPKLSLLHFISIALLPIKTKDDSSLKSYRTAKNDTNPSLKSSENEKNDTNPSLKSSQIAKNDTNQYLNSDTSLHPRSEFVDKVGSRALFGIKVVIWAVVIHSYDYMEDLHQYFILVLYCLHLYLGVEIVLAITAIPVQAILGLDIEPQFNEPYLATSLQDFWGRRWNLMVSSILRPTVYNPVLRISTRIFGKLWGLQLAFIASFLVSGLMHELLYFYITRVDPTWEVTCFFLLHGICTAVEVVVKKAVDGRWRLHRVVSGPLTVVFVAVTGAWLFFPQIIRNGMDKKAIRENKMMVKFVRDILLV